MRQKRWCIKHICHDDPSATLRKARGAHQQELLTSARDLFQLDNETHTYNARHSVFQTTKEDNE